VYSPTQYQREGNVSSTHIRCVLAHDHVLLRQGLRRLLEDQPDIEVVAEAGNAAEAIERVFEHRPEIVIANASIFGCAAGQAEWLILQESPLSKVLFLGMPAGEKSAQDAGRDKSGWAVRDTSAEELVAMVRMARGGSGGLETQPPERREWPAREVFPRQRVLTAREREVLKLLAEGKTVRSAADVLGVSAKTVDAHKFNLMRKLGIHNKAELVMWAIQKRVVKMPTNY
jgi:two-component system response regulator NreC